MPRAHRYIPVVLVLSAWTVMAGAPHLGAQAKPAPRPTQQRPARPAPQRPARPAIPVAPAPDPAPARAAVAAAQDLRFKTVYTNANVKTESVTLIKGQRQRFEFHDTVLVRQSDQKRTIQISPATGMYLVVADGEIAAVPGTEAAVAPRPSGVVSLSTTVTDTGERKTAFGREARRVTTIIERQPGPGACDPTRQRIETDGWYIAAPSAVTSSPAPVQPTSGDACVDRIEAVANGDPAALGFPIAYTTTVNVDGSAPAVVTMEVTEFEVTTLDPALFDIPQGLTAATGARQLNQALSDVSEATLAAADVAPAATPALRAAGVVRIGVPEPTNTTTHTVDARTLRTRLVAALADAKFDAQPMAAASPAELQRRAAARGYDYLLLAEVKELKVSKPGALGGLMRAASGVAGGASAGSPRENTESTLAVKLLEPGGRQRLSTTAKGKDGSGFSLKTGLGLARFAGSMYLNLFTGPLMLMRLNGMGMANFGGMGLLGNPALFRMQLGGLSGAGRSAGLDATAGAAAYLMEQALARGEMGGLVGEPGQGPSFDESLGEALDNAAKAVTRALQK